MFPSSIKKLTNAIGFFIVIKYGVRDEDYLRYNINSDIYFLRRCDNSYYFNKYQLPPNKTYPIDFSDLIFQFEEEFTNSELLEIELKNIFKIQLRKNKINSLLN